MVAPVSLSEIDETCELPRRRHRLRLFLRWAEHTFAATGFLCIILLFTPLPGFLYHNLDRQSPLERADCIISLGGDPARTIEAARLLQEGYAPVLIVSNNGEAADMMKALAIEWGAPAERVLVDYGSYRTADHPLAVQRNCGVDPGKDRCIIVTTMPHMARSKAVFEKAGYKNLIMRDPRWERGFRGQGPMRWRRNFMIAAETLYEYTARLQYWALGYT